MSEILVVCPTRDRPEDLLPLCESLVSTSTRARMVVYVDEDQRQMYEAQTYPGRVKLYVGEGQKLGPVHAVNKMVHLNRDVRIYGMVPDDCTFRTPGWDEWLIEAFDSFPGRIGVVAAAHNGGEYVNFPWVSREWVETVGWYFYPQNFHHCCDTLLEMLGEATAMTYAPPDKFSMHHDLRHTANREQFEPDATNFLSWCVGERRELVRRIRTAQARERDASPAHP